LYYEINKSQRQTLLKLEILFQFLPAKERDRENLVTHIALQCIGLLGEVHIDAIRWVAIIVQDVLIVHIAGNFLRLLSLSDLEHIKRCCVDSF
jgi:hypothetical protein